MAVNSYKDDEQSIETGKLKTLGRLLSYLVVYKKEILLVMLIRPSFEYHDDYRY